MQQMLQIGKMIQPDTQKCNPANIQNMNQKASQNNKKNGVFKFSSKGNDK